MSEDRSGRCMCGAVRFTAVGMRTEITACHCDMCRRWSSGPFFAVGCERLELEDEDALGVISSSSWAERGFCRSCGSSLFYRITAPGKLQGATTVSLGTLDDQGGLTLVKEWFIDKRPEAYALAGEHECVTEAQVFAMYGGDSGELAP
ncbi:MAG: GFA family protein [Myxococcales bacterium]|nr:GFA family protein [Myxococcales bacterium]